MIIAPYQSGASFDPFFPKVIKNIETAISDKDDDWLTICVGLPGTGKTHLMLHGYTIFAGEKADIDQVSLNRLDFATSMKSAKDSKTKRFVGYDEANVSKREALTKWNRELIDLYLAIRGLHIFHWWNNPSLEMLDKPFIEERVKGVIFIFTKDVNRPRLYYYFRKDDILDLLEKHENLKLRTLKKHAKQYAYYRGWFKPYAGPLLPAYLAKKESRMEQKVDDFFSAYGTEENSTIPGFAKAQGIDERTAKKYFDYGVESAILREKEHYVLTGLKRVRLTPKGCDELLFIVLNHAKTGGRVGFEASAEARPLNKRAVLGDAPATEGRA